MSLYLDFVETVSGQVSWRTSVPLVETIDPGTDSPCKMSKEKIRSNSDVEKYRNFRGSSRLTAVESPSD